MEKYYQLGIYHERMKLIENNPLDFLFLLKLLSHIFYLVTLVGTLN